MEAGPRLRAGVDYNAHGSAYANLEKRLQSGHRQPVSSVWNDYAARNHFTPVGDRPGHGLLKALGYCFDSGTAMTCEEPDFAFGSEQEHEQEKE